MRQGYNCVHFAQLQVASNEIKSFIYCQQFTVLLDCTLNTVPVRGCKSFVNMSLGKIERRQ